MALLLNSAVQITLPYLVLGTSLVACSFVFKSKSSQEGTFAPSVHSLLCHKVSLLLYAQSALCTVSTKSSCALITYCKLSFIPSQGNNLILWNHSCGTVHRFWMIFAVSTPRSSSDNRISPSTGIMSAKGDLIISLLIFAETHLRFVEIS